MTFPVDQPQLLKALEAAGVEARFLTDIDLVVEHGGRLFLRLTSAATLDGLMLIDKDGDPWETYYYVPFERLAGGAS